MTIDERLQSLRAKRGWTLRRLHEEIKRTTGANVSISCLHKLENGPTNPTVGTLAGIAAAYGMVVQRLIGPIEFHAKEPRP